MDAAQRRCIQLIDEMDSELAVVCGPCRYSCKPLIASSEKKECLENIQFLQKKVHLMEAMRDAFIEPVTKALKMSALLTFCHQTGVELVRQNCEPYVKTSFTVRISSFDLSVESA